MTDVIVSGAGGFIGRRLVSALEGSGLAVLALQRQAGDVAEAATWDNLPKAQVVIHLAGRSYVPDSWAHSADFLRSNVIGTEQALRYCRRHSARLVLASAYVYGIPQTLPISEAHPAHPNNPYALSKRLAEQLCEFAHDYQDVPVAMLRLFNLFGPGQRDAFLIPTILRQIREGKEIRVMDLAPRRDYLYIDDAVDALAAALDLTSGCHILNIGAGVSHSVQEIIDLAQLAAATQLPVVSQGSPRPQEIPDVVADIRRAKEEMGWTPRWTLPDGLKAMLAL